MTLKTKSKISVVVGVLLVSGILALPARAHEAKCPHCELDIVQNTATQDNEVALKFGKKRIEYRCVMCAIADANKSYKGDVTILAPTEMKGKPAQIVRKNGSWSAPEGIVVLGQKVKHRYCQTGYRVFTNRAAFDSHVAKNKVTLSDAQPITLAQLVEIADQENMGDMK